MDSSPALSPLSTVLDEHSNDVVQPSGSTAQNLEVQPSQPRAGRPRRRKHKRRNRRQSFVNDDDGSDHGADSERARMIEARTAATRESFNRVEETGGSDTSLDMLDHRPRGLSRGTGSRPSIQQTAPLSATQMKPSAPSSHASKIRRRTRSDKAQQPSSESSGSRASTPLLKSPTLPSGFYGYGGTVSSPSITRFRGEQSSRTSPAPLARRASAFDSSEPLDYDVNNPPSVPPSPVLGPEDTDEYLPMDAGGHGLAQSPSHSRDAFIDIESPGPGRGQLKRRMTRAPEEDVCFPHDILSDIGEEPTPVSTGETASLREVLRKKKRKVWPKLDVLDQWAEKEKDDITRDTFRFQSMVEPTMVDGRYRPRRQVWHRPLEDAPFRFTYFNAEFDKTIHSQTLSGLVQPEWVSFRNLFLPDPPELESDSSEDEDNQGRSVQGDYSPGPSYPGRNGVAPSAFPGKEKQVFSESNTGRTTPLPAPACEKRYGPRPTFWLDVLSPTPAEMRVLQRAFDLHPLTVEDILEEEEREKVELFGHYYFCNYRSFEQDTSSDEYMDPVNMYWVVFRDGIISFHGSPTPHPANVRRRIRQLHDYMVVSADWISYAIIDDITDAYQPLVEAIEDQVDTIDDTILSEIAFSALKKEKPPAPPAPAPRRPLIQRIFPWLRRDRVTKDGYGPLEDARHPDEKSEATTMGPTESSADMLRRVGECRKRVMSLYRLLGNKADVIKGFAKRCNEQWAVAPRNEIGMYLGDIQDHIVTMTGNLSHYENLLSRAHSNYLAQINIRMTDRAESTNNVLNKLTVLGTIVLPMNVVTGMWGMNVLVPGQDVDNLHWFYSITAFLLMFGIFSFFVARTTFGVV